MADIDVIMYKGRVINGGHLIYCRPKDGDLCWAYGGHRCIDPHLTYHTTFKWERNTLAASWINLIYSSQVLTLAAQRKKVLP